MHNNNKELTLSAPLSGPVLTLAKVPDAVFASGAMGDGIAIDPLNDTLYSPCAGVIIHVARTGHALTIRAQNGAEVLMHVGIDTVELNGEGFALLVKTSPIFSDRTRSSHAALPAFSTTNVAMGLTKQTSQAAGF